VEVGNQITELLPAQAFTRLSVVSLIQLIGFVAVWGLVRYGPRRFQVTTVAPWQQDCLRLAQIFGVISFLILFLTMIGGFIGGWGARAAERAIWITFVTNTAFFSLGMARTGGAARSFFSQLVPIQLAGILMLEQQKAMLTKIQPTVWTFAALSLVSIGLWLVVVSFRMTFQRVFKWQDLDMQPWIERFAVFATTTLFFLSVGVTVFAYWAPLHPEFVEWVKQHGHFDQPLSQ